MGILGRLMILATLLAAMACASSPHPDRRAPERRTLPIVCTDAGWIYYIVASYRERGDDRNRQVLWANRTLPQGDSRKLALLVIHDVYKSEADRLDLGVQIARQCREDPDGRAVLTLAAGEAAESPAAPRRPE